MSRYSQTGGNTEPMPFVRRWGPGTEAEDDDGEPRDFKPAKLEPAYEDEDNYDQGDEPRKSKKDRSSKRSRSRTPDRKKRKKRSRSRESKHRKRDSRSRSRSREHKRRSRKDSNRSQSPEKQDYQEKDANPLAAAIAAAAKAAAAIHARQQTGQSTPAAPKFPTLPTGPSAPTVLMNKSDIFGESSPIVKTEMPEEGKQRTKKSRWSTTKSFVPGMPTILPSNLDENQRQAYLLQMEIEEATRKLRQGDFLPPSEAERSPSPEPIYDANGKRLNTREIRKRQELEQRRHEKIQALLRINPAYKPPADYRAPNIRLHDKVWIPQDDHPEINFVGLLIGPRGNTLKSLEAETGCKIIIRGKGSVKEGKLGRREGPLPGENEPLHAYITGTDHATIKKGCEKIREIINAALMIPDGQNELRKLQLRELAVLNGTLRPEDLLGGTRCSNCGSDQHKTWECPDAPNVTANVICTACGGAGHIAKDCKNPRAGFTLDGGAGMDDEYSALMAELGEKSSSGGAAKTATTTYAPRYRLPTGSPIVRVNLSNKTPRLYDPNNPATYPWGPGEMPPPFFPPVSGFPPMSGDGTGQPGMPPPGWMPPWPGAFPMPVPPPPGGSLSVSFT
ncbi:splicing factor 1 helix-hairpin domain-containing protein [Ditylenchus destructor]|nr:splicing factor 1 helix-hairpin domain-containing protein [Ditylenchus destructor]